MEAVLVLVTLGGLRAKPTKTIRIKAARRLRMKIAANMGIR
jgi:hypothetical protein